MTEGALLVYDVAHKEDMSLSPQQAEELYAYLIEHGLKLTMKTILEVIIILWLGDF